MGADRLKILAYLLAAFAMVVVIIVATAGLGHAQEPPHSGVHTANGYGSPSLSSAYVVDNGQALVIVGYQSWGGAWTPAQSGTQIYAASLSLDIFDLASYPIHISINAKETGIGWIQNQSLLITPLNDTTDQIFFSNNPNWHTLNLYLSTTLFQAEVATPISLLPPSVENVGGLDLLVLGILSEAVIAFSALTIAGKIIMRRALWAPKFSLLIWGHVVLIGIASAILLDFQAVDRTFAGWSPLVYVAGVCPMYFLFILSVFNRTSKDELLQVVARPQGRLVYRRWLLRTGILNDGRTVLVRETWGGWLARLFGHHVVIDNGDPSMPEAFSAKVDNRRSPTKTPEKEGFRWRLKTKKLAYSEDFKVANEQEDDVVKILWTETGEPVKVLWPRLTMHRNVEVPPKTSPEGNVLIPAHTERKLAWPHYTESSHTLSLAPQHFAAHQAVAAGWGKSLDLARVLAKTQTELYILKAGFEAKVNAELESRLLAYFSLVGRTSSDMSQEEASQEAERPKTVRSLAELLDEKTLGGSKQ